MSIASVYVGICFLLHKFFYYSENTITVIIVDDWACIDPNFISRKFSEYLQSVSTCG